MLNPIINKILNKLCIIITNIIYDRNQSLLTSDRNTILPIAETNT